MLWTQRTFDLEVVIPGSSADEIYAYMRAMKHLTHNPLITEWKLIAPDTYLIVDHVRLFGLLLRVPYRGKITALEDGTLRLEGFQSMVYVDNRTRILPEPDGCVVREQVTIRTLRPLAGIAVAQARQAHRAVLNSLKRHFARGG